MVRLGIDVGGMTIKAGVVDESGKILHKDACKTGAERGHEAVIADMGQLALRVIADAGYAIGDIPSVGIGIPGVHDDARNVVPFCPNLFWHDVPLIPLFRRIIDIPTKVGNDATIAGYAESIAGVSRGTQSSVFLTLGTGLGGGIVIDGKPYSGSHGVGSEIGHMVINFDGYKCNCPGRGCFEQYASASALIREGRLSMAMHPSGAIAREAEYDVRNVTAKLVIDLAKANDPDARMIFEQYAYCLAAGIVSIINLLDPEIIVLGGGVSAAGAFLLDAVNKIIPTMVFCSTAPFARIEIATLGNDAGIIGAAMLGRL